MRDEGLTALQQFSHCKIEIEFRRIDVELLREIRDCLLQLHQGHADVLGFLVRERLILHPANRLPLENLANQIDERQHQFHHRTADVFRVRVPSGRTV